MNINIKGNEFTKIYASVEDFWYGKEEKGELLLSPEYLEKEEYVIPVFRMDKSLMKVKRAGMQDIYGLGLVAISLLLNLLKFAGMGDSYVGTLLKRATHMVDGRPDGVELKLHGVPSQVAYAIKEKDWDAAVNNKAIRLGAAIRLKPAFSSVSFTRAGHATFVRDTASYRELIENMGIRLSVFLQTNEEELRFNAKKTATRLRLSNSGGRVWGVFDDYHYVRDFKKPYKWKGGETVYSTIYVLKKGDQERRVEVFPKDFTVETYEKLLGSHFDKKGNKRAFFDTWSEFVERKATDGSGFISVRLVKESGLAKMVGRRSVSAFTMRMVSVVKGMLVAIWKLEETHGVDLMLFDGMVKGDVGPHFRNNEFHSMLLTTTRQKDHSAIKLGRQVVIRAMDGVTISRLQESTSRFIQSILNLDIAGINEFTHLPEGGDEESVDLEEENDNEMLRSSQSFMALLKVNSAHFVQEHALRSTLVRNLLKRTEKMHNGQEYYLKDAQWRHMVVDPYAILSFLAEGKLYVSRDKDGDRGIRRKHAFSVLHNAINAEESVVYRFPFLHKYEARLLNADGESLFLDKASKDYYEQAVKHGLFRGLMVYSLWDMEAEGQSGADFDGDQTVWTTNKMVVAQTEDLPLFLDYSRVWNPTHADNIEGWVTVEGCPFGEAEPIEMDALLTTEDLEALGAAGIDWDDYGQFTLQHADLDEAGEEALWKAVASIAMADLRENKIGLFTNVSDTVHEMMSKYETDGDKPERVAELETLSLFMAVAIRWEIDAAKHGGAFYEELSFLKLITEGVVDSNKIKEAEEAFGIHLGCFFR